MNDLKSENQELKRVHIFVSGFVQGVFYRENTRKRAKRLGLTGWVRNLNDGRVEAVFEGKEEKINEIINWMKKGTVLARVKDVEIYREEYKNEFSNFQVIT